MTDHSGNAPFLSTAKKVLVGSAIIIGTSLFVVAIIASAPAVGALFGIGAAAIGLGTVAVTTVTATATIGSYIIAGGVGAFGISDAIEVWSNGTNPIRDWAMRGNQDVYDVANTAFNALGSLVVIAGAVAPAVLKKTAEKYGTPVYKKSGDLGGYKLNFENSRGWIARIDATTHGYVSHHNPHVHFGSRRGGGKSVYAFWEVIRRFIK